MRRKISLWVNFRILATYAILGALAGIGGAILTTDAPLQRQPTLVYNNPGRVAPPGWEPRHQN